mmetsp:Transcript_29650/g.55579  ORF Transcript_29650/g.55579 Transcript_29650/m.55579 type:complete len:92 (-) Transcript_29650:502-777(-)
MCILHVFYLSNFLIPSRFPSPFLNKSTKCVKTDASSLTWLAQWFCENRPNPKQQEELQTDVPSSKATPYVFPVSLVLWRKYTPSQFCNRVS